MVNEEFSRTAMLIGKAGIEKLKASSVIVFGVGGVGSFAIEALARMGLKRLDVVDADVVTVSNINRQLIALHSTVGKKKTEVIKERISDISPETLVTAYDVFFDNSTISLFDFKKYDYIIDAIDSVDSKVLLIKTANEAGVPIISSLGTGNKIISSGFRFSDIYDTSVCPLAKVMRKRLKDENVSSLKVLYSPDPPLTPDESFLTGKGKRTVGSISFVPSVAGLMIAGEVVRDLLNIG
jgi:tRNA A37 threonylcarbamoyladenosine dehydratase